MVERQSFQAADSSLNKTARQGVLSNLDRLMQQALPCFIKRPIPPGMSQGHEKVFVPAVTSWICTVSCREGKLALAGLERHPLIIRFSPQFPVD
jgi:hypothetical protein